MVEECEGCPWDASTCIAAAQEGHLEVLQWALVEGCPWDEQTDDDDKLGYCDAEKMWKWIIYKQPKLSLVCK